MTERRPSFHIQVLQDELEKRKAKNPRYSLRAFAKFLDMHPSALSRVLNWKQDLSIQASHVIINKLALSPSDVRLFIASVAEDKRNRSAALLSRALTPEQLDEDFDPRTEEIVAPENEIPVTAQTVLAFSDDLVSVMDLDRRFIFVNERTAYRLDTLPCDLIGLTWEETNFPADMKSQLERQQDAFLATGRTANYEFTVGSGKELRFYERTITPLKNSRGEMTAFHSIIKDVTHREYRLRTMHSFHESIGDLPRTMELVAQSMVPILADAAVLLLPGESGLRVAAVSHAEAETAEIFRSNAHETEKNLQSVIEGLAGSLDQARLSKIDSPVLGARNAHLVPLRLNDGKAGALLLLSFTDNELTFEKKKTIEELGRAAGLAISNARLHKTRAATSHS